ncbi:FAD-dependent oxidoreductase [Mesorhizobium microcysteis]|uniref:FAD-dependent oxidoreductase n=1 Tax=Neoaquamicrobium microcysteis TaxID=2682781 RepID=A0A5D4GSR7_9HYPH|nr:D-amino acid dehydrogenase [Mesorhizobium microcysteis]TYR30943.1 FAD-dependent oxidoreductase [Mesorhizobium microcysteis]
MHILVIGAGIVGTMTAYELHRDGHEVTVVDAAGNVAERASFANGGVVGASQVEPWAAPGMPLKLLSWLGRDDAPLLVRLSQLPNLPRWGLHFLKACSAEAYRDSTIASLRLAMLSIDRLEAIASEHNIAFSRAKGAMLKIYSDAEAFRKAGRLVEGLAGAGFPAQVVSRDEAVALEPALAGAGGTLAGAVSYPRDLAGLCRDFARAIAKLLQASGVTFRLNAKVDGFRTAPGRVEAVRIDGREEVYDAVVAATGSWTGGLLAPLGIRPMVIPTKGLSITVPARRWPGAITGAIMDTSRIFGLIRLGDSLRISGSAEITGFDDRPDPRRWRAIAANVVRLFPAMEDCLADGEPFVWAGLRPTTPDGRPVIGATPFANLYVNTGHGPQGWTGACGSARLLVDIIARRDPPVPPEPFALARFR